MFDEFEALAALKRYGTLAIAGAHLRVEASTVWKRIQGLERRYGKKLLEKKGRNAYLTPQAEQLLVQADPHLHALRDVLQGYQDTMITTGRPLRVGVSESIALSWGPQLLKDFAAAVPQSSLELATHRGSLLIEKLRHGDFDFVICAGMGKDSSTLMGEKIFEEELLLYKIPEERKIYCIEESALTFEWMREDLATLLNQLRKKHEIVPLQSYGSIASFVAAGMAGGIVPLGVALRFNLPEKLLSKLPRKLIRPIYLYSKKSFYTSEMGNKVFELSKKISKMGTRYLVEASNNFKVGPSK